MTVRWATFAIWAAAAASAVFWMLRLFVPAPAMPPQAVTVTGGDAPGADLGRVLGRTAVAAPEAAPPPASRFRLLGVLAPRKERDASVALALIAVDDGPARAYRVGAVVDGDTVLQAVRARGASLGPRGGPSTELELPPPAPAATGVLATPPTRAEPFRPPDARPVPRLPVALMPQGMPAVPQPVMPQGEDEPSVSPRQGLAVQ